VHEHITARRDTAGVTAERSGSEEFRAEARKVQGKPRGSRKEREGEVLMDKTIFDMIQEQSEELEKCQRGLREARARLDMIAVMMGFVPTRRDEKKSGPYPQLSPEELDRNARGKDTSALTVTEQ